MSEKVKSIRGIIVAAGLFFILLVINFCQTLSLVIRPFSKTLFRRFNYFCGHFWWSLAVKSMETAHGVRFVFSGDTAVAEDNSLLVVNHQSMVDIPVVLAFTARYKRLRYLKWYIKDVVKYFPGVGWGTLFLDCIFLKRNWAADCASIEATFNNVNSNRIPIWLVSFLEGTRMTPKKRKASQEYAAKSGLPALDHVMIPRTKGFVATLQGLSGHLNAVYDLTIGYTGKVPTLGDLIQGRVQPIHVHVRRFDVRDLPTEGTELAQWVIQLFVEKNALLEQFYQTGTFGTEQLALKASRLSRLQKIPQT